MTTNFGIVTACWKGDYFLVKATCASIRHFLGDVPICVIVDGDFSIQELENLYGVQPLYLSQLSNPELRRRCPGSSRAKLAAIWEGPFEHFLYLDSDAIVWGNLLEKFDLTTTDFVVMRPPLYGCLPKHEVSRWFFNVDTLLEIDPTFEWQNQPYFCAGAFAAKRNCFDLQEYLRLEALADKYPELFKFWDQGIVNYMVFSANQAGLLKYKVVDIQVVTADHSKSTLEEQYPCSIYKTPQNVDKTTIIHFCGNKPFIHKRKSFSKPFTTFRLLHYQKLMGDNISGKIKSIFQLFCEEFELLTNKAKSKFKRIINSQ
ncbi:MULTISPECIES: hypothetical protein [unclassified Nodularia (in: cyanobacteria)]|uniref:hypothetical protein n=1 Tax=unclassified Nodularia (in: cyanobacteria) TaxID=2656917 RepID=UPI00187E39FE|nr:MULTISPECIES: hypothetical protein [unclassified Nodularia (in: cyanobacteria)]MBE9199415.1 hypothetical protein [Nodularia sp. LEGE 06071]MCC2692913.1 hypothetical protein [Nodularia sp. LEGE 04288]